MTESGFVHPEAECPSFHSPVKLGNKSIIPPGSSHLRYRVPFSMPSFFLLQVPTFMLPKRPLFPQPYAWDEPRAEMAEGKAKD